jgi:hypothetical protein
VGIRTLSPLQCRSVRSGHNRFAVGLEWNHGVGDMRLVIGGVEIDAIPACGERDLSCQLPNSHGLIGVRLTLRTDTALTLPSGQVGRIFTRAGCASERSLILI